MKAPLLLALLSAAVLSLAPGAHGRTADGRQKLVLIAGKPSHPPRMHEFRAGALLLQKALAQTANLTVEVHDNGWVKEERTFEDADAIVIYADGGGGHPAVQGDHLQKLDALAKKGVGIGMMHYGVEVVPDKGGAEFKQWIGGHYEHMYSCNPIWEPSFASFPEHPITRGVKPFRSRTSGTSISASLILSPVSKRLRRRGGSLRRCSSPRRVIRCGTDLTCILADLTRTFSRRAAGLRR
jgi:hypothetical protein